MWISTWALNSDLVTYFSNFYFEPILSVRESWSILFLPMPRLWQYYILFPGVTDTKYTETIDYLFQICTKFKNASILNVGKMSVFTAVCVYQILHFQAIFLSPNVTIMPCTSCPWNKAHVESNMDLYFLRKLEQDTIKVAITINRLISVFLHSS